MLNLYLSLSITATALLAGPAQAVNKCTDAAGKVSYQQGDCQGTAKAQQIETAPDPKMSGGRWEFSSQKDEMTGETSCFAVSPFTYTNYRSIHSRSAQVRMQVYVTKTGALLTLRSLQGSEGIFHSDITGVGAKIDAGTFKPVNQKSGSHALTFTAANQSSLLSEMRTGKSARLRLRFWPYEQLYDTDPITLAGLPQALDRATSCANR